MPGHDTDCPAHLLISWWLLCRHLKISLRGAGGILILDPRKGWLSTLHSSTATGRYCFTASGGSPCRASLSGSTQKSADVLDLLAAALWSLWFVPPLLECSSARHWERWLFLAEGHLLKSCLLLGHVTEYLLWSDPSLSHGRWRTGTSSSAVTTTGLWWATPLAVLS